MTAMGKCEKCLPICAAAFAGLAVGAVIGFLPKGEGALGTILAILSSILTAGVPAAAMAIQLRRAAAHSGAVANTAGNTAARTAPVWDAPQAAFLVLFAVGFGAGTAAQSHGWLSKDPGGHPLDEVVKAWTDVGARQEDVVDRLLTKTLGAAPESDSVLSATPAQAHDLAAKFPDAKALREALKALPGWSDLEGAVQEDDVLRQVVVRLLVAGR